ncbi:MAG: TrkH family potassium uptake protein [Thermodesulfobacteriota bacterium]|nr:TrkH family potassium uptake protein [Thermodesulfobacteriota bacterium]
MPNKGLHSLSPWTVPIIGFLGLILTGTALLLAFPTARGDHIPAVDALFMATSATCVTGLTLYDIGRDFTLGGQLTILGLIQMGGLGIMLFSAVFLMVLGRGVTFRSRFLLQDIYTHSPSADLFNLLKHILFFTVAFESLGTLALFVRFLDRFEPLQAFYFAAFHAVSAFCNAGFSLFSDSLMAYVSDATVNVTVAGLIIAGGLGFLVLYEVRRIFTASQGGHILLLWRRLSLHTKLVLVMTSALLAGGTAFFLMTEWSGVLRPLPAADRLLAALFQSTTTRTAGFNTLDFSAMTNVTLMGTIILMFIGASPGSTGGGIKTTTLGVLVALSRARIGGTPMVHAFKRSISEETINRAFGVTVLSLLIVTIGTVLVLLMETGSVPFPQSRGRFMEILFETTSAFGTVGLSMGITPTLGTWSKVILSVIMFTGRLGPLVIAMAITAREVKGRYVYAEEPVMIG